MIREVGEVIRLEGGFAWVKTIRESTCGACQARHGCGQKLLNQMSYQTADIKARLEPSLKLKTLSSGDYVEIGISENAVVVSSLVAYGLPILSLIVAVSLISPWFGDFITAFSGLLALLGASYSTRWLLPKLCTTDWFEPVVLSLQKQKVK